MYVNVVTVTVEFNCHLSVYLLNSMIAYFRCGQHK